jgi:hypothetical protein
LEAELPRGVIAAGLAFPSAEGVTAEWERKCSLDFAQRALDDLESLTDKLSGQIGITNPLEMGGMRGWSG